MPFRKGKHRTPATTFGGPMGFHIRTDWHHRANDLLVEILEKCLKNRVRGIPVDRNLMPFGDAVCAAGKPPNGDLASAHNRHG